MKAERWRQFEMPRKEASSAVMGSLESCLAKRKTVELLVMVMMWD